MPEFFTSSPFVVVAGVACGPDAVTSYWKVSVPLNDALGV